MAKGTITLYKGKAKKDGKPFTALRLEVGKWDTLYFPQSKFEMEYIENHLNAPVANDSLPSAHDAIINLNEDPKTIDEGVYN